MMMFPMLTEETPTYICFSGFDCAEAGTGKVNMTAHISAADVMLRKGSLRARDIGHLQAYCLQVCVASIEVTAESFFYSTAPGDAKMVEIIPSETLATFPNQFPNSLARVARYNWNTKDLMVTGTVPEGSRTLPKSMKSKSRRVTPSIHRMSFSSPNSCLRTVPTSPAKSWSKTR